MVLCFIISQNHNNNEEKKTQGALKWKKLWILQLLPIALICNMTIELDTLNFWSAQQDTGLGYLQWTKETVKDKQVWDKLP